MDNFQLERNRIMRLKQEYDSVPHAYVDGWHSYLADLARDRLGLLALARWEQARDGGDWTEAVTQAAGDNGSGQMSLLEAF